MSQSNTSVSTRNEILPLRGRFQRASALVPSSASDNRSSSTDARNRPTLPGLAFRRFAFLVLAVMTALYTLGCNDDMFRVKHSSARDNTGKDAGEVAKRGGKKEGKRRNLRDPSRALAEGSGDLQPQLGLLSFVLLTNSAHFRKPTLQIFTEDTNLRLTSPSRSRYR